MALPAGAAVALPITPPSPAAPRAVLVVDDSPEDAEVVRRYLRRAPDRAYAVRHVQLAGDALAVIADPTQRPDVVLLDYGLPDMSGVELLDAIAALLGGAPVPVVMLTGTHADVNTAVEAMRHGALDYLAKDALTPDSLRRAVDGAVERFLTARVVAAQRDELERRHRALDMAAARTSRLLAIVTALGGALTPEEVAAVTLREVMPALGASVGLVAALRPGAVAAAGDAAAAVPRTATIDVVQTVGFSPRLREAWARVPLDAEVPLAAVVRTGEPLWMASTADAVTQFAATAGVRAETGYEAAATLPLAVDGRVLGALALGFPTAGAFAVEDREFLLTVARQCAQALERARLYAAERAARAEAEIARAEAEHANRAKAQFLAAMSHELRTPLNAIAGYTELMELGIRGPVTAEQREDLGRVRSAGRHLQALINDILNHARLEAGRVRYDLRLVRLDGIVADVEALVTPQLRAKGLEFTVAGCAPGEAGPLPPLLVWADPEKVRQVLLNLLTNAIKFTVAGGRVSLACVAGLPGGMVGLRVSDTGRGIAADQLDRIFEPFVQVDRHRTPESQQGVGLGLAISRDLARGMGGDLTAESVPDEGSTFTLTLPGAPGPER